MEEGAVARRGPQNGKKLHPKQAGYQARKLNRAIRITEVQEPKRQKEEREKAEKETKKQESKVIAKSGYTDPTECKNCGEWHNRDEDHIDCDQILRKREAAKLKKEKKNKNAGCISSSSKT